MGCLGNRFIDPEIAKLLASLDEKVEDYLKIFKTEVEKLEKKFGEFLQKRHKLLEELTKIEDISKEKFENLCKDLKDLIEEIIKDKYEEEKKKKKVGKLDMKNEIKTFFNKDKKEINEDIIKQINKRELKQEIEFLSNETDKMHYIFELGLDLVEPLRKIAIDKLLEKAKTAPAIALNKINSQIEEIKSLSVIEFLNSTYGKALKDALVKKGLSETVLREYKKSLMKSRKDRRKEEKKEFGIEVNEFEGEDISKINLDLMSLIKEEFKTENIAKNYKAYIRDKLIDAAFGKN